MTIHYEKYNQEEGSAETAQRGRHQHVQRTFRREAPCAPGQDGNVRRRIRRYARVQSGNVLQLGNRICNTFIRQTARNCESLRYFGSHSDTERVENVLSSSPTLAPTFQASGKFSSVYIPTFVEWRKFPKNLTLDFQASNGLFKRISAKYLYFIDVIIVISIICRYDVPHTVCGSVLVFLFTASRRNGRYTICRSNRPVSHVTQCQSPGTGERRVFYVNKEGGAA